SLGFSPLNPPQVRDFEREILSQSPPKLGGWGAEVLNNEARKFHRIHVWFRSIAPASCADPTPQTELIAE
ncbi:hypothetical protein ACKFKG_03745, partial [Phormidesmis sp. 146-35]